MKRVLLFLLVAILLFSGCEKTRGDAQSTEKDESKAKVVKFTEGIWPQKEWDGIEFPVERDCIPDKETAVAVARTLLKSFQNEGYYTNYVEQSVFYDIEDKIWIVSFSEDALIPGADFCIAIRQENAEIVKMWVGE